MDFPHSENDLIDYIAQVARANARGGEEKYYFALRRAEAERELVLSRSALATLIRSLHGTNLSDETGLYTENSLELAVSQQGSSRLFREDLISLSDESSSLTYEISEAGDQYLLWLIANIYSQKLQRSLFFGALFSNTAFERLSRTNPDGDINIFDFIRATSVRVMTLKINSSQNIPLTRLQTAAYSFLFHLAYNLDVALVPQRFFEEIVRRNRLSKMRRSKPDELDPPRRIYNESLVNYYILAVSTDNPSVQFLSHYHVLEHFFEAVFNDDLTSQIRMAITEPGFSYKRKKDIEKLVTTVTNAVRFRSETVTFSESNALRLTLMKYVDVVGLVEKLTEYDSSILHYYAKNEVPFCRGCKVELNSRDEAKIFKSLSDRIYSTRNALVHSKEGDKLRYTPFKDERALVKELPIIRFISEMVILTESEVA